MFVLLLIFLIVYSSTKMRANVPESLTVTYKSQLAAKKTSRPNSY